MRQICCHHSPLCFKGEIKKALESLHVWTSWEEPNLGGSFFTNWEIFVVKYAGFMQVLKSKCMGQILCLNITW